MWFFDKKIKISQVCVSGFAGYEKHGKFNRLEGIDIECCTENVKELSTNTAGGRIRFVTDSSKLYIYIKYGKRTLLPYFTVSGSCGIDVYIGSGSERRWKKNISPYYNEDVVKGSVELDGKINEITILLPLYAAIEKIDIYIERKAVLRKPPEYKYKKPIVFYGSSITQGCSASRPGTCYPEQVARYFDSNLLNLGFSSGANGEKIIAEYISKIEMTALIIEYDHNAPSLEHLKNTHKQFVEIIRAENRDIPIIVMSRYSYGVSISKKESEERKSVIRDTVNQMKLNGDKKVFFIDGEHAIGNINRAELFVDGIHPNDLGMYVIADNIIKVLSKEIK